MDTVQPPFSIGALDAHSAATLVSAASDIALVLDETGIIRDVALGSEDLSREGCREWLGLPWTQTVTVESRAKVETLLRDAGIVTARKWRHVNHMSILGADIPIVYSTIRVGDNRTVIALGRDLRANAALQQKLVDAQQTMERHYWRLRDAETRYRVLFQASSEAVLIVDAASRKILEANAAANSLFGSNTKLAGRLFPEGFEAESERAIQSLLSSVSVLGRAESLHVQLLEDHRKLVVSASTFRQDNAVFFLIRLSSARGDVGESSASRSIVRVMESAPDAFVVCDLDGKVLTANRAFVELVGIAAESLLRGQSLDRWLGRSGVDFNVLMSNLRQQGAVRLFASQVRSEHDAVADVEVSAVAVLHGEQPCLGFVIRNVAPRLSPTTSPERVQLRTVNQLAELVGRVSLKELVRESVDLVERRCIEAALELSGDNRASAAEMLGLSRQSLYTKLRRYGLGDLELEAAE